MRFLVVDTGNLSLVTTLGNLRKQTDWKGIGYIKELLGKPEKQAQSEQKRRERTCWPAARS